MIKRDKLNKNRLTDAKDNLVIVGGEEGCGTGKKR